MGGYQQMVSYAGSLKDAVNEVIRVVDAEAKDPKAAASEPCSEARRASSQKQPSSFSERGPRTAATEPCSRLLGAAK